MQPCFALCHLVLVGWLGGERVASTETTPADASELGSEEFAVAAEVQARAVLDIPVVVVLEVNLGVLSVMLAFVIVQKPNSQDLPAKACQELAEVLQVERADVLDVQLEGPRRGFLQPVEGGRGTLKDFIGRALVGSYEHHKVLVVDVVDVSRIPCHLAVDGGDEEGGRVAPSSGHAFGNVDAARKVSIEHLGVEGRDIGGIESGFRAVMAHGAQARATDTQEWRGPRNHDIIIIIQILLQNFIK